MKISFGWIVMFLSLILGVHAPASVILTVGRSSFFSPYVDARSTPAVNYLIPTEPFGDVIVDSNKLLLTTFAFSSDGGNLSGFDAESISAAESFLNLQAGTIPAGGALADASAVKLVLALNAGDIVSFDYQFLTSATASDGADFAFYTLQFSASDPTLQTFATTALATTPSTSANFDRQSVTATVTLSPISFSGSYTLGFGIADRTDDAGPSGVLIDNVRAVPEPAPALLLMLGILGRISLARPRGRTLTKATETTR